MDLSNELLMQFAKATKSEDKTKKETTVYGTAVKYNGGTYVRFDGSELLTPVITSADFEDNERVSVLLKDHTATVTGNISAPSARNKTVSEVRTDVTKVEEVIADVVRTEQLKAESARIDSLVTKTAKIDVLEADNVTINNRLTVTEALIKDLTGDSIDVENLTATFATVLMLDVERGRIDELTSGLAEIDTLIFGSATGTTIQTSFANAVIAQLGDAQIDSAMIKDVSASKISAGDIITNNVRVKSQDGSLIISNETMQISDDSRVRVQIGKDASNDYSINVWDTSGNLMFSKGGITDSAIKEAIIRNDMVSDTASIAAHKLDIDSLFEEINGSTNTINSTKVYLDDKKQTLAVAFKTLDSTVTSQGKTITSQGTAISTIQGQITSKIWQQDIDTAQNAMSTQYSTLSQDLSGFKTTVGDTYATNTRVGAAETSISQLSNKVTANVTDTTNLGTKVTSLELAADSLTTQINDLKVGGRNLIADTSQNETVLGGYPATGYSEGYTTKTISTPSKNEYVLSFDAKSTVSGDRVRCHFYNPNTATKVTTSTGYSGQTVDGTAEVTLTTSWKRYWIKYNQLDPSNVTSVKNLIVGRRTAGLGSGSVSIRAVKFEEGNQPTDWTPAPEDLDADVLNASKSATNFMKLDSAGLVVGNMTTSTLGKNVLIASDSVQIRTGTTENAIFGADLIELAKNNSSATISMLNGRFKIYYSSDIFEPGLGVYGVTTDGKERLAFQPLNENNNLTLGWGGYNDKANCTNIYGHNINLIAGNDMAFECGDWKINIDGNLFAKASNSSFVELIGLSSDDNTAIGHGGYTAGIGKTNIYGNKIQHIVNTKSGSATYKPYYEAGDSFETEWYGAGFISSSAKVVYFSIPLAKPVIGSSTPNVTVSNATTGKGGLQVRQDSNYVFGSSSSEKATPSSYSAKVMGNGNFVQIEATMANNTNAVNNAPCGINANIKITFS